MNTVTAYRLRWTYLSGASEIAPGYWRDRAKAQAHAESAMSGEEMVRVTVEAAQVPADTRFLDGGTMPRSDVVVGIVAVVGAALSGIGAARQTTGGRRPGDGRTTKDARGVRARGA